MGVKNLLITGGAGFIGLNLVSFLSELRKYKITILDNLSTGNYTLLEQVIKQKGGCLEDTATPSLDAVVFQKGDIRDTDDVGRAVRDQDAIIHLAAQTGVMPSMKSPREDADVNILGTLNLLEAAAKYKTRKFVLASSAAPLGEQEPPLDETKVPRPLSPYGASKLAAEAYCSAFHGSFGLDTSVLRFSNVYGPLSFHKGSVIALFIKRLLEWKPLVVYGDGEQTRDFLYVEDIARIISALLEAEPSKTAGQVFQLGTGVETSVNRLVALLEELSPGEIAVRYQPARKGEITRNYTDPGKICQTLGVRARTHLETGLRDTWNWFLREKENRPLPHRRLT